MSGLFGEEFEIKIKETDVKKLVKKTKKKEADSEEVSAEKLLKSKKITLEERLAIIKENVIRVLGKQKNNILVIKDTETFENYVTEAIHSGRIAIDTETNNSLDPITCKLMGLCLYYPGGKQAYIPVNHINNETSERFAWQVTEEDCRKQLQRIVDSKIIKVFHNNKFDYKVIKCTCGIEVTADWDTLIASYLIDENDFSHGLKQLYIKYIDPTQEKYSIDHLFNNVLYEQVDPEIFAYYAATDSLMTDKLYLYQKPILESDDYKKVYELFTEVEMPVIQVAAEMELTGILFDKDYDERLKVKFESNLKDVDDKLAKELSVYADKINDWKLSDEANAKAKVYVPVKTKLTEEKIITTYPLIEEGTKKRYKLGKPKVEQLSDPIDLNSPTQLAILFYDILKYKAVDKDDPRGTGEEILEKLNTPLTNILLERRHLVKMLDAFINSLPEEVNEKTGKIHCNFNQYGAKTGRWSCSEPNLQQIPSHMKSMRLLFMADPGYVLVGSDFSQQEVRVLADISKDENLIDAYKQNKDIYATVASGVYHTDYWNCMEHHQDGSANPEGKQRRSFCKSIVLGLMYSRGAAAIAEQIHSTKEEAQQIIDDFYKSFPQVKSWMDDELKKLKERGYTEDFYGRRRHIPDINLPEYEFKYIKEPETFNPLIECQNRSVEPTPQLINKYMSRIKKMKRRAEFKQIQDDAKADNISIRENQAFIARAERQCVNSIIQGSSATMTKVAMNKIFRDPELKSYDFKLLIGVHDELIGQCKEEFAEKGAARLCEIMKTCVSDKMSTPFKCDPAIEKSWYFSEEAHVMQEEAIKMQTDGKTRKEIEEKLLLENSEFLPNQISEFLDFKD